MERLGDILKKTPINTLKEDTDISSVAEEKAGATAREALLSCPRCQGAGFVYAQVPVGHPDFGRALPCACTLNRFQQERLARLERYSRLGPLARLTFDNLIPRGRHPDPASQERYSQAVGVARRFAQEPEGWLVLVGPPGCGKTHLAAAIVNYRLAQGQVALFISVPELLDHLRSTYNPESPLSYDELFEQLKSVSFLVLDDLGGHTTTPWAQEKLFQLMNYRYQERLPSVVACALPLEEMEDRLRSRLEDPGLSRVLVLEEKALPPLEIEGGLAFLRHMTLDNFEVKRSELSQEQRENLAEALRLARDFAQNPQGWLVFQGVNGCGKTHLAAAIANYRLQQQGHPVLFVTVPELLDHLRATFSPQSPVSYDELFERVKTAPLLILDDFGEQSSTPWAQAKLYQLISYRYNARLPTVFTTCLSLDEMEKLGESRMTSRLGDVRLSTVFNITATDYRVERSPVSRQTGFPPPPRRGRPPYRPGRQVA